LDKLWKNQEKMFDYKCDLNGIGNRRLTNMDYSLIEYRLYVAFVVFDGHRGNAFSYRECFTAEMSAGTTRCAFLLRCLDTRFLGVLEFTTKAPSLYCSPSHPAHS